MRRLMDDAGARIVVLIDAVAEAEQAERIVRILRLLHPIADILLVADLVEHLQHFLVGPAVRGTPEGRSEEHTSELQSLMRISYAVFCLKKKKKTTQLTYNY